MTIKGLIQPQISSLSAGNPRASAIEDANNMNTKQANLNASVGGKRWRHKVRGGASMPLRPATVPVPQMHMLYTPQNGNTNPNTQIASLSSTGMQSASWAQNDNLATKKGGSTKKYKTGGNPDWRWGCYSGGRRRSYRRRSIKHKKRTRRSRR